MRLHENGQLINGIRNKEIKQNMEQNIGLNFGSQNNEQLNMNRMDFIPNKHIKIIPKKKEESGIQKININKKHDYSSEDIEMGEPNVKEKNKK